MKTIPAIMVVALLAAAGCGSQIVPWTERKKEEKKVKIVTIEQALFCFKCHSGAQYNGAGGRFPHRKHEHLGLHCNQCHEFKGHRKIRVIKKSDPPCSTCH